MAQVLAPIVQTSGSITMLHSSSDAFQNSSAPQSHHQQARPSQMQRSQMYNGQSGGAGYRGTSAPIAPYAFSSTPQLRQDARATSAPNPHTLQQVNPARLGHPQHPSSSSDSTVSTSGSSSRSLAAPQFASKDDSVIGSSDVRKSTVEGFPASAITLSTSVPDLSLALQDAPVKPSPDRYRRGTRRTDSSNSGTASSSAPTPTPQSPSIGASTASGVAKTTNVPTFSASELQGPTRPGHNRASSVDDMHMPRPGSIDQAKRYRRRSLSGLDANAQAASLDPVLIAPIAPSAKRPAQELRPPSSSSRHGSRPNSSQSHERQNSAGSASSTASARPSSVRANSADCRWIVANYYAV